MKKGDSGKVGRGEATSTKRKASPVRSSIGLPAPTPGAAAVVAAPVKRVSFADLDEREREVFGTPAGFARIFLGLALYPEQERILNAFAANGAAVSTRTCNEYGKTTRLIAPLLLWHMATFVQDGPTGGCISTSGSWPQVTAQLVPALKRFEHKFPKWSFGATEIKHGATVKWLGFSTNDAGRAEGFHGTARHPLLATVDEAKTVQDDIITMIETRCRPQRMGLFSTPGYAELEFYRSQTINAKLYSTFLVPAARRPPPGVRTLRDHMLVSHLDYRVLDRNILKAGGGDFERGLKSAIICSAIFAEFMEFVEGAVIKLADIEACLAEPPRWRPGQRHGACDFGGGMAENVFALRVGNRVEIRDAWVDADTTAGAGRFVKNFVRAREEFGLTADEIDGDADGAGANWCDSLRDAGWDIGRVHSGSPAMDAARYKNAVAEEWHEGSLDIQYKRIILPDDAELKVQLTNRKSRVDMQGKPPGRLWLESKDQLAARNVASPDRADAVLRAMRPLRMRGSVSTASGQAATQSHNPWADDYADQAERAVPEELIRGMDAGG